MAKKRGLAANRRRRRARRNASHMVMNPPVVKDLLHQVAPGFAAYAATRLASRIIYTLAQRRWPKLGRHAGALASLVAFGGAWFGAHRIKRLSPYHDAILIGSGIAAAQTVARTYIPRYGWIVSDYRPDDLGPAANAQQPQLPPGEEDDDVAGYFDDDDGDQLSYYEAGARDMQPTTEAQPPVSSPPLRQMQYAQQDADESFTQDELDLLNAGDDDEDFTWAN